MKLIRPLTVYANVPWKVLENIEKNWQNSSHIQQMNFFLSTLESCLHLCLSSDPQSLCCNSCTCMANPYGMICLALSDLTWVKNICDNGFSPQWTLRCLHKDSDSLDLLSQCVDLYGFSPLWTLWYLCKDPDPHWTLRFLHKDLDLLNCLSQWVYL